jgi:uncharacterized protein (TIRG00374 family)
MTAPGVPAVAGVEVHPAPMRWSVGRVVLLVATALCLYFFAPSIVEVFSAWDKLGRFHPVWIAVMLVCEAASFWCVWLLQCVGLGTRDWFTIINTQLAGNAFNRITPGGGATGTALQVRMLADAGFDTTATASALTVQSLLITAAVTAMPILVLPAVAMGTSVPSGLEDAVWIGLVLFAVMIALGALFLGTRRPVELLGRAIERVNNVLRPKRPTHDLGTRLLTQRDEVRITMGEHWLVAVAAAVGRWGFEYLVLLVALFAIDARPNPWLVLLAFVAASALGMIPLTPGGLGFVEAGLTATLALAGIDAGPAALATLIFRLFSFWLPLPIGAVAAVVYRRRYPRRQLAGPAPGMTPT